MQLKMNYRLTEILDVSSVHLVGLASFSDPTPATTPITCDSSPPAVPAGRGTGRGSRRGHQRLVLRISLALSLLLLLFLRRGCTAWRGDGVVGDAVGGVADGGARGGNLAGFAFAFVVGRVGFSCVHVAVDIHHPIRIVLTSCRFTWRPVSRAPGGLPVALRELVLPLALCCRHLATHVVIFSALMLVQQEMETAHPVAAASCARVHGRWMTRARFFLRLISQAVEGGRGGG